MRRHHEQRAVKHPGTKKLRETRGGRGIKAGGGLVEEKQRSGPDKRLRKSNPLTLATRTRPKRSIEKRVEREQLPHRVRERRVAQLRGKRQLLARGQFVVETEVVAEIPNEGAVLVEVVRFVEKNPSA